jgi:hypothetical protein
MKLIYPLLLFIYLFNSINCTLSFELTHDRPRCYLDELFKGSVMLIKWKIIYENGEKVADEDVKHIQITVSEDESGIVLHTHEVKTQQGKFSFHSGGHGYYGICMQMTGWKNQRKMFMSVKLNSDNMEEPDLMKALKNADIDPVHAKAREILEDGKNIVMKQATVIQEEDTAAVLQINMSKSYYYMTIVQVVVVIALGIYQIFNFRKFLSQNSVI